MTTSESVFSAASSAAGYLSQSRLALALCLRHAYGKAGIEVAVERLDDVSLETDGEARALAQTKHADLGDISPDLWKTLRIWSQLALENPNLPNLRRSRPPIRCGRSSQASRLARASVINWNWTARPAFYCATIARVRTSGPTTKVRILIFARSQPRTLLSIARSNNAGPANGLRDPGRSGSPKSVAVFAHDLHRPSYQYCKHVTLAPQDGIVKVP